MPRPRTVYRGKRKYSWIITLVIFVVVILILAAVWLFSYLQRYLVYDKDGLQLVMPSERAELAADPDSGAQTPVSVPKVDVEIVVDRTDYSGVETNAGMGLTPLHALFVAAEDVTQSNLDYYGLGIGDFNAIVLELKGPDGFLSYHSGIPLAESYGVNGTLELTAALEKLKAQDVRLVAQISGLVDETMALRNGPIALKNAVTDSVFQNSKGAWLDPYDDTVRAYLKELLQELHDLGFDEVILSGMYCPDSENLQFSKSMTLTPDAVSAVSSLAFWLRGAADEIGIALSAVAEADALAAGESENIGQDIPAFFKAFDRVIFDMSAEDGDCMPALKDALGDGDADLRIVPAAEDYAPNHGSYIVK